MGKNLPMGFFIPWDFKWDNDGSENPTKFPWDFYL